MSHFSCVRGPLETRCSLFLGGLTHSVVMDVSKKRKKVPDFLEVREEVSENDSGKLSVRGSWYLLIHYLSMLSRLGSPPRWVGGGPHWGLMHTPLGQLLSLSLSQHIYL